MCRALLHRRVRIQKLPRTGGFLGRPGFGLVYLAIAGSIVGFTAYIWLLHYESPTEVGNVRLDGRRPENGH